MKAVHAALRPLEYAAFQRAAKRERLSLRDTMRQAAIAWAREREEASDSLNDLIGGLHGPMDSSKDIDVDYEED